MGVGVIDISGRGLGLEELGIIEIRGDRLGGLGIIGLGGGGKGLWIIDNRGGGEGLGQMGEMGEMGVGSLVDRK